MRTAISDENMDKKMKGNLTEWNHFLIYTGLLYAF